MYETLLEAVELLFPNQAVLTIKEVAKFLACEEKIIHNWIKRADRDKRPPRLIVGNEPRFPKKQFIQWLAKEQATKGAVIA